MALHLMEKDIEFESVFLDTGWEHSSVYEYLRGELSDKIGPIKELQPKTPDLRPEIEELAKQFEERLGHPSAFLRLTLHKGIFPSRLVRYCTRDLKIDTIRRYLKEIEYPVSCIGIRAEESVARSKLPERELSTSMGCMVWRPLIQWSKQDVIDIHRRHNLAPNPLYLKGAERVGCWPCIYSRKSEIRFIAEKDKDRIDLIRDLEAAVSVIGKEKMEARGREIESDHYGREIDPDRFWQRTFFYGRFDEPLRTIDERVEWSKTSHGGKQGTMFSEDELEPGCLSWGLCDAG